MKKTRKYGFNDVPGANSTKNGKRAYDTWLAMLARCYSGRYKAYIGCTVCDEWLLFSNFKRFYDEFGHEDMELDKDILFPGNRIYSPETCIYVTRKINGFVRGNESRMGKYPTGVYYNKRDRAFVATIMEGGKTKYIGYYKSSKEAHEAWFERKMAQAIGLKRECDEINPILFDRLIAKIKSMKCEEK